MIRNSSSYLQTTQSCNVAKAMNLGVPDFLITILKWASLEWRAIQLSSPRQLTIYTIYQHVSVKIQTHTDKSLICNLIASLQAKTFSFSLTRTVTIAWSRASMFSSNSLTNSTISCGTIDINRSPVAVYNSYAAYNRSSLDPCHTEFGGCKLFRFCITSNT